MSLSILPAQARSSAIQLLGHIGPCPDDCRYLTKAPYLAPPAMVYYCQGCGRRYVFSLWEPRELSAEAPRQGILPFQRPA